MTYRRHHRVLFGSLSSSSLHMLHPPSRWPTKRGRKRGPAHAWSCVYQAVLKRFPLQLSISVQAQQQQKKATRTEAIQGSQRHVLSPSTPVCNQRTPLTRMRTSFMAAQHHMGMYAKLLQVERVVSLFSLSYSLFLSYPNFNHICLPLFGFISP